MSDKQSNIPEDHPGLDADTPNASERVEVTVDDLPLHCPMPGKRLWDSHPKVYLPIEKSGEELCPYCGTRFVLRGPADSHH
jgi:uncharacterized Zn-finger protein